MGGKKSKKAKPNQVIKKLIMFRNTEMMVKDLSPIQGTFSDGFSSEFCQIFKRKIIGIFYKLCQLAEGKKIVLKVYRTTQGGQGGNTSRSCA